MLVEIPDLDVIFGLVLAFIGGLFTLFVYSRLKADSASNKQTKADSERLEFYERQLIDMKIRLDALEIQGIVEKPVDPNLELKQFMQELVENHESQKEVEVIKEPEIIVEKPVSVPKIPNIEHVSPTDYVLHLITNKAMTSRDIQITTKRSREHTSRLMKKLFENGLVQRNTETKPYTYSITEKGKSKVEDVISNPTTV